MAPYSVLGGQSEATIDQANIAMRGMPWYQTQMKAWGQDPGHPTLTSWQSDQIRRQAQANGFVVDEGNIEVDDHGNFNPKGHKLRNTLIVAGLAAATIATMGAAGVFSGAAGGGAAAGAGGGAAAGALPAGVTLEGTAAGLGGASTAVGGGAAAGGLSSAELAAMAGELPGASSLVGTTLSAAGIPLAKAAGYTVNADGVVMDAANVAPDYIQSASGSSGLVSNLLKYALPVGGGLASSLIAANASSNASAAQTKYLEDALAYEKENDLYKRGVDAAAVQKEAARYGDYQSRISPFIDNGISSNDRMSSLVGLPARTGATSGGAYSYGGGGSASGGGGSQGVALTPQITQKILDNYKALGLTPTGAGTGPTDSAYFAQQYAATGGSTPDNDSYWFGPNGRIAQEARKSGIPFQPTTTPPASPTSPTSQTPPITGAPVAKALVKMRAPDGTEQDVAADQVDHYTQRGATVV